MFRDILGLKLPDICLTSEEKPEKTSPRKLVSTGDRTPARCVTTSMLPPSSQRWANSSTSRQITIFVQNII